MSDDSSSDDEPMMSSPDASGDEHSDNDDDVFTFHAKKFQKTNATNPTPPRHYRRRPGQSSFEEKLTMMEKKKQAKVQKINNRILSNKTNGSNSNSDNDSEVEDLLHDHHKTKTTTTTTTSQTNNNNNNGVINIADSPPNGSSVAGSTMTGRCPTSATRATRPAAAAASSTRKIAPEDALIELLIESSDEEDTQTTYRPRGSQMPLTAFKGASKEAMDVLQKSRLATRSLLQAQYYHAEDIHVYVPLSPPRPTVVPKAKPTSYTASPALLQLPKHQGKTLRITCRIQSELNGKKQPLVEKMFKVREHDPLQVLFTKFCKEMSIPESARITFSFDGRTLQLCKSAAFYEIEDQDLMDISAKVIAMPSRATIMSTTTTMNRNTGGPKLSFTLRRKVGKKTEETKLSLGSREHFATLLKKYQTKHGHNNSRNQQQRIAFQFDGETLDWHKTPSAYDMESGDLIDVVIGR
jgi:hypothetical protein